MIAWYLMCLTETMLPSGMTFRHNQAVEQSRLAYKLKKHKTFLVQQKLQ